MSKCGAQMSKRAIRSYWSFVPDNGAQFVADPTISDPLIWEDVAQPHDVSE